MLEQVRKLDELGASAFAVVLVPKGEVHICGMAQDLPHLSKESAMVTRFANHKNIGM